MKLFSRGRRVQSGRVLLGCMLLQCLSAPLAFAKITPLPEVRVTGGSEPPIIGLPSVRVMRPAVRYVTRWRTSRVKLARVYRAGVKKGYEEALLKIRHAPPPPPQQQQNIRVCFVDPRGRPLKELTVVPVVAAYHPQDHAPAMQRRPPLQTDAHGRVALSHLPVPCAVTWDLQHDGTPGAAGNQAQLPEWQIEEPRQATVALPRFSGSVIVAGNPEPALDSPWLRVASRDLEHLQLVRRPRRQPPVRRARRPKLIVHTWDCGCIRLVRNVVDFEMAMPPDAKLYGPRGLFGGVAAGGPGNNDPLETEIPVRCQGNSVAFRLPASCFPQWGLPLRIAQESKVGIWESVIRVSPEQADPYAESNKLQAPEPKLARLNDLQLKGGVDLLALCPEIEDALGGKFPDPGARHSRSPFTAERLDDQSWLGHTPDMDIRFRIAPNHKVEKEEREGKPLSDKEWRDRFRDAYADLIRVKSPNGGAVAGITVGDDAADVRGALRTPDPVDIAGAPDELSYLDGGIVFLTKAGRISTIEVRRSRDLLTNGTTAFAPKAATNVYIANYQPVPSAGIQTKDDLKRYLESTGIIQVVSNQEDADYVLSCQLTGLAPQRRITAGFPLRLDCSGDLTFDLQDTADPAKCEQGTLTSASHSDWLEECGLAAALIILIRAGLAKGGLFRDVIVALLGLTVFHNITQSMQQAEDRMPRLIERDLDEKLAGRLYEQIDCRSRVSRIDYASGDIVVPLGTKDGVTAERLGTPGAMFDVYVDGKPLPLPDHHNSGLTAEFYVAEVVSTTQTECRCRLRHIKRWLTQSQEETSETDEARYMLARLPQASSGAVSVCMRPALAW